MQVVRELEEIPYEKRLTLNLFSIWKRRLRAILLLSAAASWEGIEKTEINSSWRCTLIGQDGHIL